MNNRVPGAAMTTVRGRGTDGGQGEIGAEATLRPRPEWTKKRGRDGRAANGVGGDDEGVREKSGDNRQTEGEAAGNRAADRAHIRTRCAPSADKAAAAAGTPLLARRTRRRPVRRGRARGVETAAGESVAVRMPPLPLLRAARAQGPPGRPR